MATFYLRLLLGFLVSKRVYIVVMDSWLIGSLHFCGFRTWKNAECYDILIDNNFFTVDKIILEWGSLRAWPIILKGIKFHSDMLWTMPLQVGIIFMTNYHERSFMHPFVCKHFWSPILCILFRFRMRII